jgi:DNA-binding XRE family transcriptional regulator
MALNRIQQSQLKKFGQAVRQARLRASMTQEELGEKLSIHRRSVQKIESATMNTLLTSAIRIRQALGCRWEDLLGNL